MKLSKEELQQLIDTYRTELRLLTFRSKQVSDQLKDLEKQERSAKPKGKAGRPAKKAAKKRGRPAKKATKKRGRPAKKATKKAVKKTSKKRGRPAKKAAVKRGRPAKKAAAKRGRPAKKAGAKKAKSKGYRLNVWDELILKTLSGTKKVGVFSDFLSAAKKISGSRGLSQKDLYARINQSLHKLANKRGVLKKVQHEGRGFGYQMSK